MTETGAAGGENIFTDTEFTGSRDRRDVHPDSRWFPDAGLGVFFHWGISSVHGEIDISWGMRKNTPWDWRSMNTNKIRPSEYFALAERFNPRDYNPDLWISAASAAGARYAVLTARHHEGYALWPSAWGDFSTRTHMQGRDLLQPYVDACRRYGLKVGFYYSPPDWHYWRKFFSFTSSNWDEVGPREEDPEVFELGKKLGLFSVDSPDLNEDWEPAGERPLPDSFQKAEYAKYLRGQIEELLTRYGKIDLIWFDGTPDQGVEPPISQDEIRKLQPGIVINPRMHRTGDFETPECELPSEPIPGWWEVCFPWNRDGWGYSASEIYHPLAWMLDKYAKTRAWHGNLLINLAPDADGKLPESCYRRLEGLAEWQKKNSKALVHVDGGNWPVDCSVPYTVKDNIWYLFMAEGVRNAVVRRDKEPRQVTLLSTGTPVPFAFGEGKTLVTLRPSQQSEDTSVVKLEW